MLIHGLSKTRAYASHRNMLARCYDTKNPDYVRNYQNKGIQVCQRWRDGIGNFYEDMAERPPGMTLERVDCLGNYKKSNCDWADRKTQQRNRPSANHYITYQGETLLFCQLAERIGITHECLRSRLFVHNFPIEKAVNPRKFKRGPKKAA